MKTTNENTERKTSWDYGYEWAEELISDGAAYGMHEKVSTQKNLNCDIPHGDYDAMREAGIEPVEQEYWRGFNYRVMEFIGDEGDDLAEAIYADTKPRSWDAVVSTLEDGEALLPYINDKDFEDYDDATGSKTARAIVEVAHAYATKKAED
jgi:hypothetical protein